MLVSSCTKFLLGVESSWAGVLAKGAGTDTAVVDVEADVSVELVAWAEVVTTVTTLVAWADIVATERTLAAWVEVAVTTVTLVAWGAVVTAGTTLRLVAWTEVVTTGTELVPWVSVAVTGTMAPLALCQRHVVTLLAVFKIQEGS